MKDLDALESQIPYTVCKLEMIFPPSFFNVMVHLVAEVKIAGPVRYRWMYPIERYEQNCLIASNIYFSLIVSLISYFDFN